MGDNDSNVLTSVKIIILGESGVGKTSFLLRFIDGRFLHPTITLNLDFYRKIVMIDGKTVELVVWDTGGTERFRSIARNFYRDVQGAILVYDVSNLTSLMKLESWLEDLDHYSTHPGIIKMIVGNKTDKINEKNVRTEDGARFAQRHNSSFMETSVKTNDGVGYVFEELARKIIRNNEVPSNNSNNTIKLHVDMLTNVSKDWLFPCCR